MKIVGPGSAEHAVILWRQWREALQAEAFASKAWTDAVDCLSEAERDRCLKVVMSEVEVPRP